MKVIHNSMKKVFTTCLLSVLVTVAFAQGPLSTAVMDISYKFIKSEGTNASAVAWIPSEQMYVTVIAGNSEYPIEGFDANGKNVFAVTAGVDCRGLWYNPKSGNCEINGAGEIGWKSFSITSGNVPSAITDLFVGSYQPDFQSVGTYDAGKKKVIFLDLPNGGISMHSRSKPSKSTRLLFKWQSLPLSNINTYSVGYTGHIGYEFVVLDYVDSQLIFFDRKGNQTARSQLPSIGPLYDAFAFSFANDRAFLYDKEMRIWYAYKVF